MYSKGIHKRHPTHQVLQDGYTLDLTLKSRQWKCSNPDCNHSEVDSFSFLDPYKETTKIISFQILQTLKDIKLTTRKVAEQFHVSDTYVHQLFMKYVNLPRLPVPEIMAVDEVYSNISFDCKYALVIMDFVTGDIIDILSIEKSHLHRYTFIYFVCPL